MGWAWIGSLGLIKAMDFVNLMNLVYSESGKINHFYIYRIKAKFGDKLLITKFCDINFAQYFISQALLPMKDHIRCSI